MANRSKYRLVEVGQLVTERKEIVKPWLLQVERFNYIGLEQVETHTGRLIDFKPKLGKEIRSPAKTFQTGDILFGRLRCYRNRVYLADGAVPEGICSAEFWVLVADPTKISPVILRELLASEHVLERVKRKQVGVVLPRSPLEALLKMKVPVPPMEAQRNLESRLPDADAMRRHAMNEVLRIETTRAALVGEMFRRETSD